ncbi:unnamed protein product [Adineta steineri]|uniref:Uncharacterized protein n=1 Tax=Adineta steineri TaxID=433720 RepID=A0A815M6A1_9BILA|nr:unnamed protein product [Adineta steineri]CAF3957396.1 unnamed protein product [Adineta steineri]
MPLLDARLTEISRGHPIKLNPLFSPYRSCFTVLSKTAFDFIRYYYPSQFEVLEQIIFSASCMNMVKTSQYRDDVNIMTKHICENEQKRLRNVIQQAAYWIWKEIQAREDVNILDINCNQSSA